MSLIGTRQAVGMSGAQFALIGCHFIRITLLLLVLFQFLTIDAKRFLKKVLGFLFFLFLKLTEVLGS